jgi:hypothetical protein
MPNPRVLVERNGSGAVGEADEGTRCPERR